jgi:hypothetical protein
VEADGGEGVVQHDLVASAEVLSLHTDPATGVPFRIRPPRLRDASIYS